jgi:hypothetical protein
MAWHVASCKTGTFIGGDIRRTTCFQLVYGSTASQQIDEVTSPWSVEILRSSATYPKGKIRKSRSSHKVHRQVIRRDNTPKRSYSSTEDSNGPTEVRTSK